MSFVGRLVTVIACGASAVVIAASASTAALPDVGSTSIVADIVSASPSPPPDPSPSPPCITDEWDVYTALNPISMAYAPNTYATMTARITNKTSFTFTRPAFWFDVSSTPFRSSDPAPVVRWRVDSGAWHSFALHASHLGVDRPQWSVDKVPLPAIRAHSTYTLAIGMAFRPGTSGRTFMTLLQLTSAECGDGPSLGSDAWMSYGYEPAPQANHTSVSSGSGSNRQTPPTRRATPAATPIGGAAAVPTASTSPPTRTSSASHLARAPRPVSDDASSATGVAIGGALLILVAAVATTLHARRRRAGFATSAGDQGAGDGADDASAQ